jgi:two-component sensor histidine kinase
MGLDQYLYVASREDCSHADQHQIAYRRKHPNLHGWMEKLWESKGRPGEETQGEQFNGIELELTLEDIDALEEAVRRIASIALVHETLSSSSDASVAFDDVLNRLVTHALELSPRMTTLQIIRDGEFGSLEPRIATPLALVVTELIHNALEHGLEASGTALQISVTRSDVHCEVRISDDGVGLPKDFDLAQSSNLGLQIVRTLTENELKGDLTLRSSEKGTVAELNFPLN